MVEGHDAWVQAGGAWERRDHARCTHQCHCDFGGPGLDASPLLVADRLQSEPMAARALSWTGSKPWGSNRFSRCATQLQCLCSAHLPASIARRAIEHVLELQKSYSWRLLRTIGPSGNRKPEGARGFHGGLRGAANQGWHVPLHRVHNIINTICAQSTKTASKPPNLPQRRSRQRTPL
jgi:hypothetical protein